MPKNSEVNPTNLERRDLLKGLAVVLGAAISPACQRAAEVPAAQRMAGVARWSSEQRAIAHRCADLIMPATDTPSALAVGVGEFMDYVASVWLQQSELEELLAGLNGLQEEAQRQYTKNFVDLSEMEQVQLLTQMETAGSALNAGSQEELRSKVFARLKELTVVGYYSSEVGAKQSGCMCLCLGDMTDISNSIRWGGSGRVSSFRASGRHRGGSGISGGWAAKELAEKGLNVLMLERGKPLTHGADYIGEHQPPWQRPNMGMRPRELYDREYPVQSTSYAFDETTRHFWNNDQDNPYDYNPEEPFHWLRADVVGGRSLFGRARVIAGAIWILPRTN